MQHLLMQHLLMQRTAASSATTF
eukprot:COSAG06_NODE_29580_length_553_cov_52858.466960_1_plen_22_part_10